MKKIILVVLGFVTAGACVDGALSSPPFLPGGGTGELHSANRAVKEKHPTAQPTEQTKAVQFELSLTDEEHFPPLGSGNAPLSVGPGRGTHRDAYSQVVRAYAEPEGSAIAPHNTEMRSDNSAASLQETPPADQHRGSDAATVTFESVDRPASRASVPDAPRSDQHSGSDVQPKLGLTDASGMAGVLQSVGPNSSFDESIPGSAFAPSPDSSNTEAPQPFLSELLGQGASDTAQSVRTRSHSFPGLTNLVVSTRGTLSRRRSDVGVESVDRPASRALTARGHLPGDDSVFDSRRQDSSSAGSVVTPPHRAERSVAQPSTSGKPIVPLVPPMNRNSGADAASLQALINSTSDVKTLAAKPSRLIAPSLFASGVAVTGAAMGGLLYLAITGKLGKRARKNALRWRNALLGVGSAGLLALIGGGVGTYRQR